KQKYRNDRPKPGLFHTRHPVAVEVTLTADTLVMVGRILARHAGEQAVEVRRTLAGPFEPARDAATMAHAARTTLEKLGPTRLALQSFTFRNDAGRFVAVSRLNALRREMVEGLEAALDARRGETTTRLQSGVCPTAAPPSPQVTPSSFRWS